MIRTNKSTFYKDYLDRIESLVKSLTPERLIWCITLFDYGVYVNRVVEAREKWERYEITLMELIDSAVHILLIEDGFAELSDCVEKVVLSLDFFVEQTGKKHDLIESFVWIPMLNEYNRRYHFDSKLDDIFKDT